MDVYSSLATKSTLSKKKVSPTSKPSTFSSMMVSSLVILCCRPLNFITAKSLWSGAGIDRVFSGL